MLLGQQTARRQRTEGVAPSRHGVGRQRQRHRLWRGWPGLRIGSAGNDHLYGGAGTDVVEGNDGSDTAFGGIFGDDGED